MVHTYTERILTQYQGVQILRTCAIYQKSKHVVSVFLAVTVGIAVVFTVWCQSLREPWIRETETMQSGQSLVPSAFRM